MNPLTLKTATQAAKRFLEIAEEIEMKRTGQYDYIVTGRTSGALRRQSMELTRALADLRKPG